MSRIPKIEVQTRDDTPISSSLIPISNPKVAPMKKGKKAKKKEKPTSTETDDDALLANAIAQVRLLQERPLDVRMRLVRARAIKVAQNTLFSAVSLFAVASHSPSFDHDTVSSLNESVQVISERIHSVCMLEPASVEATVQLSDALDIACRTVLLALRRSEDNVFLLEALIAAKSTSLILELVEEDLSSPQTFDTILLLHSSSKYYIGNDSDLCDWTEIIRACHTNARLGAFIGLMSSPPPSWEKVLRDECNALNLGLQTSKKCWRLCKI